MKVFVLDTSAVVRLYVPDGPIPEGTREAIEAAWRAEAVALAPELALAEIGQVLHKKTLAGALAREEADEIMAAVAELPIELVGHRELISEAVTAARDHGLTVYDGLFLALARKQKASLISGDERLTRAAAAAGW